MISILPFQKATTATTFGGRFAVDLGHIDPSFYFSSSSSFPPFFYILFDQAQLFFFLLLLLLPPHSAARSLAFRPLMTRSLPVSTKSRERCRRNRKQRRVGIKRRRSRQKIGTRPADRKGFCGGQANGTGLLDRLVVVKLLGEREREIVRKCR